MAKPRYCSPYWAGLRAELLRKFNYVMNNFAKYGTLDAYNFNALMWYVDVRCEEINNMEKLMHEIRDFRARKEDNLVKKLLVSAERYFESYTIIMCTYVFNIASVSNKFANYPRYIMKYGGYISRYLFISSNATRQCYMHATRDKNYPFDRGRCFTRI